MIEFRKTFLKESSSIQEAVKVINEAPAKIALVIDNNEKLIGIVTDGDVRRGILQGYTLDESVSKIMNNDPKVATPTTPKSELSNILDSHDIDVIPILDENETILSLYTKEKNLFKQDTPIFLLAGGLGTRLGSLTKDCPKPMLRIGEKPILQIIIEQFKSHGYTKFYISVNYKSKVIKDYFKDGSDFGISINYVEENVPLGTAGSLKFIEHETRPIIAMNGDVLTTVNFEELLKFHNEQNSDFTICTREYSHQIPFGVINSSNDGEITITEKPIHKHQVNAGIYVVSPKVLSYIEKGERVDMPQLLKSLPRSETKVFAFPIHEYWLDVGRVQEFEKAQTDYHRIF